jgi:membrane fusion protein (multidrug efflux system)
MTLHRTFTSLNAPSPEAKEYPTVMRRLARPASLAVPLAVLLLVSGCGGAKADKKADEAQAAVSTAIAVQVAPVTLGTIQTELALSGDIRPAVETPVSSKVGGRLQYIKVDEGSRVQAGQEIAKIDAYDYTLQVLQAQAQLASAQANRASAVTTYETAQDNVRRLSGLHAEGGVSDQTMISTKAQASSARNSIAAADAQIAQARAAIALNQSQLANTAIKAPFSGVVTKKSAEVGTMLSPMTPVATVASTDNLELKVPVGQGSLAGVRVGGPVSFTVPTYVGRVFTGKVAEVSPTVDPQTRSAQITIRIPNPKGELSPGMFARVTVPTIGKADAVVVTPDVIVTEGEKNFVYVVEAGKATRRPVTLGLRTPTKLELASGVRPGEQIVTLGQGQLQDGDTVKIVSKDAEK